MPRGFACGLGGLRGVFRPTQDHRQVESFGLPVRVGGAGIEPVGAPTLHDSLAAGRAKVIANLVFFTEPQIDPGLAYINKLAGEYREHGASAVVECVYEQEKST